MKIINKCEICGSKNFKFLFDGKDKLLGVPGKFSLFKCLKCGVVFLNPQPSNKDLKEHYSNEKYYSLKKIDNKSKKFKFKIFLYNLYFNKKHKNPFLRILFQPFKFIIRSTEIEKNKKLLDIGSGSGQFLYEMKQFNLDVYGIEPSEFDEEGSRKMRLNIKKGFLKKGIFEKGYFDIITINHVLEHVNNPLEVINESKNILKKGGLIIIGVPNTKSLSNNLFRRNWLGYEVPRHLFNFSDKNLKKLLQKEGFKINKIRYNSRPSQFVISLLFALNIKNRNKIIISFLDMLFLPLTWLVNLLKWGDQIEIWCVKK